MNTTITFRQIKTFVLNTLLLLCIYLGTIHDLSMFANFSVFYLTLATLLYILIALVIGQYDKEDLKEKLPSIVEHYGPGPKNGQLPKWLDTIIFLIGLFLIAGSAWWWTAIMWVILNVMDLHVRAVIEEQYKV